MPEPTSGVADAPIPSVDGAASLPEGDAAEPAPRSTRDFSFEGSLREGATRGTLINSVFLIGISGLGLVRGFVLAALVSQTDYGVWGVLVVAVGTLLSLKQVGINDKYIEQDEEDQETAFQKAFTLDLILSVTFVAAVGALLPVIASVYDTSDLILPGLVVLLAFLALPFQAPLWIYYRRMDFFRQRLIQAIDPILAFVVTVGLAALGAGYWAFAIGFTVGVVATSIVAVILSPYAIRLRFEPGTAKRYLTFSWPLFAAALCALITAQSGLLTARLETGLAAAGALTLALQITVFTDRVDQIVTGTLYPAICAVKDRRDVLFETFVKSNRLALMWAVPFGIGLALFSPDLIRFGIGSEWEEAIVVLQVLGVVAAFSHIGFNWTAYFRAQADTKPIVVQGATSMIAFVAVGVPSIIAFGIEGFAMGAGAQAIVALWVRTVYLKRLFHGFRFFGHAFRAFAPTIPAAAIVLFFRAVDGDERTLGLAALEFTTYSLVTVLITWKTESALLQEIGGYVRGVRGGGSKTGEIAVGSS